MSDIGKNSADLFGKPISAEADSLAHRVTERLATRKAALVENFPTDDPGAFVDFLGHLGTPLENYGAGSGSAAFALHPRINVVRCSATGTRVQEQGGPLPAHSARAFSKNRPKYIAMLMVEDGWPAQAGETGESTIVRWTDALGQLRRLHPDTYDADHAILAGTPITITAQHVTDEWSDLPLLYRLDDAVRDDDIGARYSLAIRDQLPGMQMAPEVREPYAVALGRFAEAANHPAARYTHTLSPGQMIILDNNRFGHGRLPFPTARHTSHEEVVNPRTLWSTVVD